jgi:lysophospholipase L1-like esterase
MRKMACLKEIAEDGIHPNKLGYEKMEAILMKNLK